MIRPRQAGAAVIVGGLTLFSDLALRLLSGLGPAYFVVAAVTALCLAGGPCGIGSSGALGSRARRTAAVGTATVMIGAMLWIAAFGLLLVDPDAAFTQRLTPAGSLLLAVGMLLLGVAVPRARRLAGWRRSEHDPDTVPGRVAAGPVTSKQHDGERPPGGARAGEDR